MEIRGYKAVNGLFPKGWDEEPVCPVEVYEWMSEVRSSEVFSSQAGSHRPAFCGVLPGIMPP